MQICWISWITLISLGEINFTEEAVWMTDYISPILKLKKKVIFLAGGRPTVCAALKPCSSFLQRFHYSLRWILMLPLPKGFFLLFFFFKHFFIALHLKFTVCIFPLQPYLVLEIKGDRNSSQNKCDCHIWHFPRTVQTLCQRHAGLGMEAANTAINCCGLHLYNVSQSPEDIKQTYKSILSSSGTWLSPRQRPSAPQRQQHYLWGQAKLQSSAESPGSATDHFPYVQNNPSFGRQNNPPKHSRKLWSSSQLTFVLHKKFPQWIFDVPNAPSARPRSLTFGLADHHVAVLTLPPLVIALHLNVIRSFRLQVIYQVPLLCTCWGEKKQIDRSSVTHRSQNYGRVHRRVLPYQMQGHCSLSC